MNAFPRLSAWLGLAPAPNAEAANAAPETATAPPTAAPMDVEPPPYTAAEEEATAAAAAAWLSPELATAAPPTPTHTPTDKTARPWRTGRGNERQAHPSHRLDADGRTTQSTSPLRQR